MNWKTEYIYDDNTSSRWSTDFRAALSRSSADISVIDSLIQIGLQGIQNNENNLEEEEQCRRTHT